MKIVSSNTKKTRCRDFIYTIGEIITSENRSVKILSHVRVGKNRLKGYQYECINCKNVDKISEDNLKNGRGCNVCCTPSKKVLKGYNDLWTTDPEIATILKDKSIGHTISRGIHEKQFFECPNCKHDKTASIHNIIKKGLSCPNCSDGISYPEKFMNNMLDQLNVEFKKEEVFTWSKNIPHTNEKLSGNKRYDFYIPSHNCIVETHGSTHFYEGYGKVGGRKLTEEVENDRLKECLAKENGISNYVTIDCSKSEFAFIKNSILKSKMAELFDLRKVDWNKCHKMAIKSIVNLICKLYNEGEKDTNKISQQLRISQSTVVRYLKYGAEISLCNYNPKDHYKRLKNNVKIVQLSNNNVFIRMWNSMKEAAPYVNIHYAGISKVCNGQQLTAGGFKWMYKEDYEKYIEEQNTYCNEMVLS